MNKILMMSSEQVKSLKEILKDGGQIIRFITKDGKESVQCNVMEVLFYDKANSKRKMKCVELDKVFPSITETAKYFNCTPTSIRYAAKNKTKCRGYSFEYVVGE